MKVTHLVYDDGHISVAMIAPDEKSGEYQLYHMAVRWLAPKNVRKNGLEVPTTNAMGGETDWFLLPHTLGVGVAKALIEREAADKENFDGAGFSRMVTWLVDRKEIFDGMCY
jgi:hypothetical protein